MWNCILGLISHIDKQTVNMCFLSQWKESNWTLCGYVALVVYRCDLSIPPLTPPSASRKNFGGFVIWETGKALIVPNH